MPQRMMENDFSIFTRTKTLYPGTVSYTHLDVYKRQEEAGLFYAQHPEEDKRLGAVGHVRMDFGRSGNEFWHTWWPPSTNKIPIVPLIA